MYWVFFVTTVSVIMDTISFWFGVPLFILPVFTLFYAAYKPRALCVPGIIAWGIEALIYGYALKEALIGLIIGIFIVQLVAPFLYAKHLNMLVFIWLIGSMFLGNFLGYVHPSTQIFFYANIIMICGVAWWYHTVSKVTA